MKPIKRAPRTERSAPPIPQRPGKDGHRSGLRGWWWWLLDLFEARRAARVALYLTGLAVLAGGATWFWGYPAWTKRNAIRIARGWLDAGQLRYAAEAAQQAAAVAPESPEPWRIAAELARRGGQTAQALEYTRRAAALAPENQDLLLEWAADALRDNQDNEASATLDRLTPDFAAASPHAQRLRGEIARRQQRFAAAKGYFEAAIKLEGPLAVNEVPLGLVLLNSTNPALRQHGLELLGKWTADREWGATALRNLLEDALTRNLPADMLRRAEALLVHPGCTVAYMPRCLLALSLADRGRFNAVVEKLERDHAATPQAAAQLLSWLNRIGQGAEGARWMRTLPPQGMRVPPLVVEGAEALRQAGDWPALQAWTAGNDWGAEVDFLRWTYGLLAARQLGDETRAEELWQTLYSHAQLNSAHGLFAGSTLYSWGREREAVALWRRVGEQEGQVAIDALGSLARHYQVKRDADGLYQTFRRLNLLQPKDRDIANNFAFYALLTGREQRQAERIARENLAAAPQNPAYLATCAFALTQQNQPADALALLAPRAAEARQSPALGFAYGLALAGAGRKAEAKALLTNLPPGTLTLAEVELIKTALGN